MKIFSLYPLSILGSPNLTVGGNCYIIVCRIGASLMQLRNISIMYYRPFIHGSIFTVQKKRLVVCRCCAMYIYEYCLYCERSMPRRSYIISPPPPPSSRWREYGIWRKKAFLLFLQLMMKISKQRHTGCFKHSLRVLWKKFHDKMFSSLVLQGL